MQTYISSDIHIKDDALLKANIIKAKRKVEGVTFNCTDFISAHPFQGLVFVDTLLQIVSTNNWNLEEYNTLFQQWLILLLSLIDFDQDPRACLQEMLSSELPVARRYQKFLVARVGVSYQNVCDSRYFVM